MNRSNKGNNRIIGKLIRPDAFNSKSSRNGNEFDATKPSVLICLTIAYIAIVFSLIIGIPWMGSDPTPIPPEDLPAAVSIAAVFYIIIVGGLYIRDRLKK